MICQNPECDNEVQPRPGHTSKIYCSTKCRNRAMRIRERERRRIPPTATHPCKRCGGPAGYKKVYCDNCKKGKYQKGQRAGIPPLNTASIRASRQREQEIIDRIVAKALENGNAGPDMYRWRKQRPKGVKVG